MSCTVYFSSCDSVQLLNAFPRVPTLISLVLVLNQCESRHRNCPINYNEKRNYISLFGLDDKLSLPRLSNNVYIFAHDEMSFKK